MAIVVGRNNRCMLSLLDEDIEPLRTDVGDKKAAECILRDYDLIGKTRIILIGSRDKGTAQELKCRRRRWPLSVVKDMVSDLFSQMGGEECLSDCMSD